MSTFKKILLGFAVAFVGIPMLVLLISLITMSPEDKQEIERQVAQQQATQEKQRMAAQTKQNEAAARRQKEKLVFQLCGWAQDAVKNQLKAPASAQFPNCVLGLDQYQIRATPDGKTYWVAGYVDSQNSFGAMLRSKFIVKFEHPAPEASFTIVQVVVE